MTICIRTYKHTLVHTDQFDTSEFGFQIGNMSYSTLLFLTLFISVLEGSSERLLNQVCPGEGSSKPQCWDSNVSLLICTCSEWDKAQVKQKRGMNIREGKHCFY